MSSEIVSCMSGLIAKMAEMEYRLNNLEIEIYEPLPPPPEMPLPLERAPAEPPQLIVTPSEPMPCDSVPIIETAAPISVSLIPASLIPQETLKTLPDTASGASRSIEDAGSIGLQVGKKEEPRFRKLKSSRKKRPRK